VEQEPTTWLPDEGSGQQEWRSPHSGEVIDTDAEPEQREADKPDHPQIYVASLTDYNAGVLHGEWLDASNEEAELQDQVDMMLTRSPSSKAEGHPAEEWAIHDHQGFGSLQLSEYMPLGQISRIAQRIIEHGPAFAAWVSTFGVHDEDLDDFTDCYAGTFETVEDFAHDQLESFSLEQKLDEIVPEYLRPYVNIDTAGFARDLELNGYLTAVRCPGAGFWIFEGC
jgi:antirestriction protein